METIPPPLSTAGTMSSGTGVKLATAVIYVAGAAALVATLLSLVYGPHKLSDLESMANLCVHTAPYGFKRTTHLVSILCPF